MLLFNSVLDEYLIAPVEFQWDGLQLMQRWGRETPLPSSAHFHHHESCIGHVPAAGNRHWGNMMGVLQNILKLDSFALMHLKLLVFWPWWFEMQQLTSEATSVNYELSSSSVEMSYSDCDVMFKRSKPNYVTVSALWGDKKHMLHYFTSLMRHLY